MDSFWAFGVGRSALICSAFILSRLVTGPLRADGMEGWWPVDNAQLQEKAPTLDPEANAEILDCHILLDDTDRPGAKKMRWYYRYKVYDPSKATGITRISTAASSYNGQTYVDVDVRARLIKPDGTIRLFGKEAIQERDLQRTGSEKSWLARAFGTTGFEMKEKYIATGGIEPGSILEVQTLVTQNQPPNYTSIILQSEDMPIRHLRLEYLPADGRIMQPISILLNQKDLKISKQSDPKRKSLVITADNLPAYYNESFVGPVIDRALTFVLDYNWVNGSMATHHSFENRTFDRKEGPWIEVATKASLLEQDVTGPSKEISKLVAATVAGSKSDLEKAQRIHNYVRSRYILFGKTPRNAVYQRNTPMPLPEEVAFFDKNPDTYIWAASWTHLAVAMYRAAGLQAQVLLLPNSQVINFNPAFALESFLPGICARVLVGGTWYFSMPNMTPPLPFGSLPWQNRGNRALIAQDGKAEFVSVPEDPPSASIQTNTGTFQLDADGTMDGTCQRSLVGQLATNLRVKYEKGEAAALKHRLGDALKDELKADSVEVSAISGFEDPDAPIVIDYAAHFPDYAETEKGRLSFRVNPFRAQNTSLFPAETRHYNVSFAYKWTEKDHVSIKLPSGYALEAPSMPPSQPGKAFSFTISISGTSKSDRIVVDRSFVCNAEIVPVSSYPALKDWFDRMARSDGHELVLARSEAPSTAAK